MSQNQQKLQLTAEQLKFVRETLGPYGKNAYAFGSRAKGTARELSDLDLTITGSTDAVDMAMIRESFENSNLPFKVDLVLWERIDDNFKETIKNDLVALNDRTSDP